MDLEKKLKKALEEAKLKKDEAKTEDETITDQLKRGIAYRKDQLLAISKHKIKKLFKKGKEYGQKNLLINK
jgi:hypothetical protein